MGRLRLLVITLGVLSVLGASQFYERTAVSKISPSVLKHLDESSSQTSVLVVLKEQADLLPATWASTKVEKARIVHRILASTAIRTQDSLVKWLSERGIEFQRFYVANTIALFGVDEATILEIAERPEVRKVISNSKWVGIPKEPFRWASRDNGVRGIGPSIVDTKADKVWKEFGAKGKGVVIAGADTGVQFDHPALKNQYRGFSEAGVSHDYSWHDAIHKSIEGGSSCGYDVKVPCDDQGHGTHTVGTVVGDDGQGNQIGMAPEAKWVACRNMDNGVGRPSTYIECFEWFLAPYPQGGDPIKDGKPEMAPNVINNSWGCPESEQCKEAEILPILKAVKAAGIMTVASAGNDGPGCSTINAPPAMHSEETLSVGAHSHSSGDIAYFSSRGPSKYDKAVGPDVTAPGVGVRSAMPGGSYGSMSGTSMAGPHVVGQVALLWSFDKKWIGQVDKTIELIRKSAIPTKASDTCGGVSGDQIPNNTWGWGKIDVYKAVTLMQGK